MIKKFLHVNIQFEDMADDDIFVSDYADIHDYISEFWSCETIKCITCYPVIFYKKGEK